ncbi:hypothetical protein Vretimale_19434, partial [Volvox reticuliferus]
VDSTNAPVITTNRLILLLLPVGEPAGRLAVPAVLGTAHAHNATMDSSADAIVHLAVNLGKSVVIDNASLLHIAESRRVHNVPHNVALDGLVLRHHGAAGLAAHPVHMATAVLGATPIPPLLGHFR